MAAPREIPEPRPDEEAPRAIVDRLVVAGVSHRTGGQDLRDRLFVDAEGLDAAYGRLRVAGLADAVLLSTCDRVEVVALADDSEGAARAIAAVLAAPSAMAPDALGPALFSASGADALKHLFAVAASLDAQVLGEPEILGQLKAAVRGAAMAGTLGPELARVFDAAFAAAKRVRGETAIGENPVSIAAAACRVAGEVLGRFEPASALLLGTGEIGALVVETMRERGLRTLRVADRVPARADALAARLGAHVVGLEGLDDALAESDIVLACLGRPRPVIDAPMMAAAMKARRYRPMFLLDAAVPPDIDERVGDIDEAYLFNLGDLEHIALAGRDARAGAATDARLIVADAVAAFVTAEAGREAAPLIAGLREAFEAERARVLAENPGADAEEATRLLINRLLHAPSRALRDLGGRRQGPVHDAPAARALARLFGLDRDDGENQ